MKKFITAVLSLTLAFSNSFVPFGYTGTPDCTTVYAAVKEYKFTDIDGKNFSTKDGIPTAVVFGRPECTNTSYTLNSIASSDWINSGKARIIYADADMNGIEKVKTFKDLIACENIYFCSDENSSESYNRMMWSINGSGSITLPLIAYFDADGVLTGTTTKFQEESEVAKRLGIYTMPEAPEIQDVETDFRFISNKDRNDYSGNYYHTESSTLSENPDGTYTFIQGDSKSFNVSVYDPKTGQYTNKKAFELALDVWGGAYSGEKYNFIVQGAPNGNEDQKCEVVRVSKYSKDWEHLGDISMFGDNTISPFEAGSLCMTEKDGQLYIHSCHKMYKNKSDGLNHQANLTYIINQEDMSLAYKNCYVQYNELPIYASHSFNQICTTDGEYVYLVDHGDAYPRTVVLSKIDLKTKFTKRVTLQNIIGQTGANQTGVKVGGIAVNDKNCITVYSSINQTEGTSFSSQQNIYLAVTDKETTDNRSIKITNYENAAVISSPRIVSVGENSMILWKETTGGYSDRKNTLRYVLADKNGKLLTDIMSSENASLSDCLPIYCSDGLIRWNVTERIWNSDKGLYNEYPNIYTIDPVTMKLKTENQEADTLSGDINNDGTVNISDMILMKDFLLFRCELNSKENADMNGNGKVNVFDLIRSKKEILK